MSTDVIWRTESTGSEQTEQLGVRLGKALKGGEVIELVSDLGGGKTTFTRGLAKGAGSHDQVASPSFTINKIYATKQFAIHHFDFYRLNEPGIVANELSEVLGDPKIVTVIEWSGSVQHLLPGTRLTVEFKQTPGGSRQMTLQAPASLAYLVEAVK